MAIQNLELLQEDTALRCLHLEAENQRLKVEVDEREKLIVDNACLKDENAELRAEMQRLWDSGSGPLQAEVERLRDGLRVYGVDPDTLKPKRKCSTFDGSMW